MYYFYFLIIQVRYEHPGEPHSQSQPLSVLADLSWAFTLKYIYTRYLFRCFHLSYKNSIILYVCNVLYPFYNREKTSVIFFF